LLFLGQIFQPDMLKSQWRAQKIWLYCSFKKTCQKNFLWL